MDDHQAGVIADAIRAAGNAIEHGTEHSLAGFSLTDEQWEMLPRGIVAAGEVIAHELRNGLFAIEGNADECRPGLFDGLFAISTSLSEVAAAIRSHSRG